ncbi:MAG: hypothetical protein ABI856_14540 [Nitrospira sp.]
MQLRLDAIALLHAMPEYVEPVIRSRICDLAFGSVQQLLDRR